MARVVAVFGPTGSGKSAAALALAEAVGGELVSCDAMQLYQGLPVLTNQPSDEERARVPHHLVAVWPLAHEGSVAEYSELARAAIADVHARGRVAVVCGGSGLYLRAALAPLRLPPAPAAGVRERYQRLYDRDGAAAAHRLLADRDPAAAAAVHANDRRRVVRALELSDAGSSLAGGADPLWSAAPAGTVVYGLQVDPALIRSRIERRTRAMFERGVEDEVAAALAGPLSHTARRIHGLQDVSALLAGEIDRDEAIRRLDVRTRQYARRQRSWMRRMPGLLPVASAGELLAQGGGVISGGREHDAVREARDALVVIGAVTLPVAAVALLAGVAVGEAPGTLRYVVGTLLMAVVLLVCVASALLVADRVGRRWLNVRPYPVRRLQLIPASLGLGLLLVAGLPATQPVIVGLALVALVLGSIVAAGAAFDL